jgi:hypothetical protein
MRHIQGICNLVHILARSDQAEDFELSIGQPFIRRDKPRLRQAKVVDAIFVRFGEIYDPPRNTGVPGSICASGGETNWNKRSGRWREERSIVQNRL